MPTTFTVPPGIRGKVIKNGKEGSEATVSDFTTTRESTFAEDEVYIDPEGRWGLWKESSKTFAGDFARQGFMAFARANAPLCLLVPKGSVVIGTTPEVPAPVG
jgi:hypothetical protein